MQIAEIRQLRSHLGGAHYVEAVDLIRRFDADTYVAALDSWGWIPGVASLAPRLASAFGDVFLEGDGGFWFLDTIGGTLQHRWPDGAALQADINTPASQEELLMPELVAAATDVGLVPGRAQVLSFKIPPVLGGSLAVENMEVSDFVVALTVSGQIHRQVKDLPPGTPISGISVDGR